MSGFRPVQDSQLKGAYPHKREKMRPYTGASQRHLRRKAEAELRKLLKAKVTIAVTETDT